MSVKVPIEKAKKSSSKDGYKLSKLGRIPVGWEIVKLGDCFKLSSGNTKPKDISEIQTSDYLYPVYGGNAIMGFSKEYFIDGSIILIGRVGEYCGITKLVSGKIWITDNALYTSELLKKFDIIFLTFKLQYENLSRLRNKGGQPLVSQKPIYGKAITLPPLPEQQKIARILSTWDKAIEKTEQLIAQKQQLKKGLMQQLLIGKVRFKEYVKSKKMKKTKLGMIPEDWGILKLVEIFSTFKSGQGITSENISTVGEYPVYGGNGLRGYTNYFTHDGEYVLIGRQGALCGNLLLIRGKNYVSEHAIASQANARNDNRFLFYKLDFINLNRFSESSAQPGLSVEKLLKLDISVASLPEQKQIALTLDTCASRADTLKMKLELLKRQKKGLMQKLLKGEVRVKT